MSKKNLDEIISNGENEIVTQTGEMVVIPDTVKNLTQLCDFATAHDAQSVNNVLTAAEKIETENAEDLGGRVYWTPEKIGQELNVIVTGFTKREIQGSEVLCVDFTDKNNNTFTSGATVLVNTLKTHEGLPIVVRIVVKEKVKGPNGSYYTFGVYKL